MPAWLETALQALGGLLGLGVFGWLAKRQVDRIDALVEEMRHKADRSEVTEMSRKLDDHMVRLHKKIDTAIAQQNKINLEVARDRKEDKP